MIHVRACRQKRLDISLSVYVDVYEYDHICNAISQRDVRSIFSEIYFIIGNTSSQWTLKF